MVVRIGENEQLAEVAVLRERPAQRESRPVEGEPGRQLPVELHGRVRTGATEDAEGLRVRRAERPVRQLRGLEKRRHAQREGVGRCGAGRIGLCWAVLSSSFWLRWWLGSCWLGPLVTHLFGGVWNHLRDRLTVKLHHRLAA